MKIIHLNGYTPEELTFFKTAVFKNIIESSRRLVEGIDSLQIQLKTDIAKVSVLVNVSDSNIDQGVCRDYSTKIHTNS